MPVWETCTFPLVKAFEKESVFMKGGLLCVEAVVDEDEDDILPYRNCYAVVRLRGTETDEKIVDMVKRMQDTIKVVANFRWSARRMMEGHAKGPSGIRNLLVYDECSEESCWKNSDRGIEIYQKFKKKIPLVDAVP